MAWTILATANVFCALLSYAFLANAIANLRWHDRGILVVVLAIVICGQTWLVPQLMSSFWFRWNIILYPIWFANWLVSAFSVVLLSYSLRDTKRDAADAARLDGCGPLRVFWHIVLPLARPALLLLVIFLLMATSIVFFAPISPSIGFAHSISQLHFGGNTAADVWTFFAASLVMTLPVVAIFFFVRRLLCHTP